MTQHKKLPQRLLLGLLMTVMFACMGCLGRSTSALARNYIDKQLGYDANKFVQNMENEERTRARGYIGTPYVTDGWGTANPLPTMAGPRRGMDCKSFVGYALKDFAGLNLARAGWVPMSPTYPGNAGMYQLDFPRAKNWADYLQAYCNCDVFHGSNAIEKMLKSGKLQKGDIVITSTKWQGSVF